MTTIDDRLAKIDRMLRMEIDLPLRLAEGDSPGSHGEDHDDQAGPSCHDFDVDDHDEQAGPSCFHWFDGDVTSLAHATRSATGVNVTPNDDDSPNNSVAANADVTANDNAASNDSVAANDNVSANDDVAANNTSATNDDAAANESIVRMFDPDSVDLDTFPRCRHCFLVRRRCDGQTPCNKCRQRRCPRACRPITVELLRQYPARAERVLELARRNGASS